MFNRGTSEEIMIPNNFNSRIFFFNVDVPISIVCYRLKRQRGFNAGMVVRELRRRMDLEPKFDNALYLID